MKQKNNDGRKSNEGFKDRLKKLMGEKPMRQFAREIGVHYQSIESFFKYDTMPSYKFLLKFKNAYPETNLEWLITGDESKNEPPNLTDLKKENKNLKTIILTAKKVLDTDSVRQSEIESSIVKTLIAEGGIYESKKEGKRA